ncbi:MAG: prolyl oligopeptidase family serine peptidase [Planctomycetota bacterium]|nr:prolyl oligopeptidase family serine peptidase [Planctomycetota bacterium]
MRVSLTVAALLLAAYAASPAQGQLHDPPDQGEPGDKMIQEYLAREAQKIHDTFSQDLKSPVDWQKRHEYREEYLYMLGLWPPKPGIPLEATITGTLSGDGFVVDMLHYQSWPRLYVTANLYRPADAKEGERLPAVLYVCGHSNQGRDGNKTAYQSHGIWLARHGYVCLVLDSLQLGEIAGVHHGTYREGRWWWHSRGYTPAGVECLNGIRGIDYLEGRTDVDPKRIAVTGISGGGAATFWIAAVDERVKAAVPVSGMADLESYVSNRVINGHCDCMFLYNTFQWPWTRIASLVAPRPLLFANSDKDEIFPMDANERILNGLKRVYSLYGASDSVNSVVSIGGHAYREDIRQAAYRFINTHLKNDPRPVADSEADLVTKPGNKKQYPIDPEKLRVFPADSDLPANQLNTTIDQHFVPVAEVKPPKKGDFEPWRTALQAELRRVTFRNFPERIAPARLLEQVDDDNARLETEPGIEVRLQRLASPQEAAEAKRILLVVQADDSPDAAADWAKSLREAGDHVYLCAPRGVGKTRWTRKSPPNYVARSHALLGRTVDSGRVWDVAAAARYLHATCGGKAPVHVLGQGPAGVLAAYAALWEPEEVAAVTLDRPPAGHMAPEAPALLNVLRVCDIPDVLGMLAPRPLTVRGGDAAAMDKVAKIYAAAGAEAKFIRKPE